MPYTFPVGIMFAWTLAAVATTVFLTLYRTQDFAERLNFKITPSFPFQFVMVGIMAFNCVFCYIWEVLNLLRSDIDVDRSFFKTSLPL